MRPIKLRMKNFGPFENETLDFTQVKPMFLITGKTGSGKSTIFDAMTFALYGSYSGARGKLTQKEMKSNFAKVGSESFVEFTFSVQDIKDGMTTKTYKVKRIVPYEYENTKGKIATKASDVELYMKDNDGIFIPLQLKTAEERTKEIANNIIGLQYDEFNQIVLLPQGKFSEFLTQTSSKREETLKKIFPLGKIERVVEKLKEKKDAYSEKLKGYATRIEEITKGGGSEEKFKEEIEKLGSEIANLEKERDETQKRIQELTIEKTKKEENLKTAEKIEETNRKIAELESKRTEMENLSERIAKSKKAKEFAPEIERNKSEKEHLEKAAGNFDSAKSELEEANKNLAILSEKEEEMNNLKEKNKADSAELESLKKKLEQVQNLLEAKKQKKQIEDEIEEFKKSTQENEERIEEFRMDLKKIANQFEINYESEDTILTSLLVKQHDADEKITANENELSILKKIDAEEKKLSEAENALKTAEEKSEEEKRRLETKKQTLERLKETQREFEMSEKAASLAKHLKSGCKCPVCGSTTHPEPAKQSGISVEDEIEEQEQSVEEAEKDFEKANEVLLSAKKDKEHQEKTVADLKLASKCGLSISDVEKILSELKKSKGEIQSGYEEACAISKSLKTEFEVQKNNKDTESSLNARLEKANGIIEEQEKNISGDKNEDVAQIKAKIETTEADVKKNSAETEKFDKDFGEAKNTVRDCEVRKTQTEKTLAEATQRKADAQKALDEKIESSDFTSEEEIVSQIMENDEAEEKRIADWRTELESLKTLVSSTKIDESIDEIKDAIAKIKSELEMTKLQNAEFTKKINDFHGEKRSKEDTLSELQKASALHGKLLKESEIYISLYKDLNGETGKKNLFTSWILATNFSEVVDYANSRFLELSGGRYQFNINATKAAGKHGLDIAINDAEIGDRAPATLSGGETFQASISLALALTDVICQHSGGIRLDSLFIDEGFGSLDQESLDKAIATLKKIQEQKIVGVISHVDAMGTEIKSHVVVHKGNEMEEHSKIEIENLE